MQKEIHAFLFTSYADLLSGDTALSGQEYLTLLAPVLEIPLKQLHISFARIDGGKIPDDYFAAFFDKLIHESFQYMLENLVTEVDE